jgi:NAD(P)-dependent dehydrogenase (short-subunit alcohol dehydrogenase family)
MSSGIRTFDGAVALITGGASGIGRAFGVELARRGAEVVLTDLQAELAEEAAAAIVESGGRASSAALDVRDRQAVDAVVRQTVQRAGRLDYVFANAGTGVFGEAHLLEERDWDLTIDVNLHGVVNTVRAAYPQLVAQGFGHLVNVASLAGLVPSPFLVPYATTKHAVVGLSKTLRIEAARFGVRVSAICPGAIRTPILTGNVLGRSVYSAMTPERMLEWWRRLGPIMDVEPFAKQAIDAVAKNEGIVVLPRRNRALLALLAWMPARAAEKVAAKMYQDTLRDFPEIARGP